MLVDTGPDLREQLIDANVDWLDAILYTHEHADHTHGIDDLRGLFLKGRRRLDVYADDATSRMLMTRFSYCFVRPPDSEYPPILNMHGLAPGTPLTIDGQGRADHGAAVRCRSMAISRRSASASATSRIRAT